MIETLLFFIVCVCFGAMGIELYNPVDEDKKKRNYGFVFSSSVCIALAFYVFFNYVVR